MSETVGHIEDDIRSLAAAGAETLLVPNVVDLGMTPLYRGTSDAAAETELAARHNQALNDELGGLAKELGVEIVVVDFASGFNLILSDSGALRLHQRHGPLRRAGGSEPAPLCRAGHGVFA